MLASLRGAFRVEHNGRRFSVAYGWVLSEAVFKVAGLDRAVSCRAAVVMKLVVAPSVLSIFIKDLANTSRNTVDAL